MVIVAMFFYLVAALLLFLFAQQASVLAREQQLRIALSSRAQQLQAALDQAQARSQPAAQAQKIRIIDTVKIKLAPVDRITHCSGAGDRVELYFADGGKRLHSGSFNELEAELPPAFLRVHRSHVGVRSGSSTYLHRRIRTDESADHADGSTGNRVY